MILTKTGKKKLKKIKTTHQAKMGEKAINNGLVTKFRRIII